MIFENKPKLVLYLKRQLLQIYKEDGSGYVLKIPLQIINNLEIIDSSGLDKLISNFAISLNLRNEKAVLILSDEVLFRKIFQGNSFNEIGEKTFLNELPFDPLKISKKQIPIDNQILTIATNKELCLSVKKAFEKSGINILRIIPLSINLCEIPVENLTPPQVKLVINSIDMFKPLDFLIEN